MHRFLSLISDEHKTMLSMIRDIEQSIRNERLLPQTPVQLLEFGILWNAHESHEDKLLAAIGGDHFSRDEQHLILSQHRELKGHWRILTHAIIQQDPETLRVALDTDGRMLFDKFRKHIAHENSLFKMVTVL
jgi:hypothetical protein